MKTHESNVGAPEMYRAQFYLRKRGEESWTPATLDEVYPRSWIRRALVPSQLSVKTSKQLLTAEALEILAKAKPILAKRGLEVDFQIVLAFF
jgi:hypothetical protein